MNEISKNNVSYISALVWVRRISGCSENWDRNQRIVIVFLVFKTKFTLICHSLPFFTTYCAHELSHFPKRTHQYNWTLKCYKMLRFKKKLIFKKFVYSPFRSSAGNCFQNLNKHSKNYVGTNPEKQVAFVGPDAFLCCSDNSIQLEMQVRHSDASARCSVNRGLLIVTVQIAYSSKRLNNQSIKL